MGIDRTKYRMLGVGAVDEWYCGLDIGQSVDPSAFAAIQHVVEPLDDWACNDEAKFWKRAKRERFFVKHLERLPLQMPYPQQIEHVARLLDREPLRGATFVLDYTGVGRPVADSFVRAGLRPQCVLITAGNEWTRPSGDTYHVPKQFLISNLESRMHSGELKFAPALTESAVLREELRDFARNVSATGRISYNARSGSHDDTILAICIALFLACNQQTQSCEELKI